LIQQNIQVSRLISCTNLRVPWRWPRT